MQLLLASKKQGSPDGNALLHSLSNGSYGITVSFIVRMSMREVARNFANTDQLKCETDVSSEAMDQSYKYDETNTL